MHKAIIGKPLNRFLQLRNAVPGLPYAPGKTYETIEKVQTEIIVLSSYPPRECGIATYTQDLIESINSKFTGNFDIQVCALESASEQHLYNPLVKYTLNTDDPESFNDLTEEINNKPGHVLLLVEHEFGFYAQNVFPFMKMLYESKADLAIVFHTVLPNPDEQLLWHVDMLSELSSSVVVMTKTSADILTEQYGISHDKISIISHGTHLTSQAEKNTLKTKYGYQNRKVLSTFGLLSTGKSIETTLDALPDIVKQHPEVLFLIIGKTHPSILMRDGEQYLDMLRAKVFALDLQANVQFINRFLPLPELLEYLQMCDIYLFTSKDPNQAVSGTFSYAISCGCPIISTPIPHALEVLRDETGIIFDFGNHSQLAIATVRLLNDETARENIRIYSLQRMAETAWENSAIAHVLLFKSLCKEKLHYQYKIPVTNLRHIHKLSQGFGMLQFSSVARPDPDSGYTLDDNARALVAMCQHYEMRNDNSDLFAIQQYLLFIQYCQQTDGSFLNYVHTDLTFSGQNAECNLEDANGRAIWALGYMLSLADILPDHMCKIARETLIKAIPQISHIHSTRAMAFMIKGLHYYNLKPKDAAVNASIHEMANRLVQMYRHEKDNTWHWFESYLTYANSILPEAMLCAYLSSGNLVYRNIAIESLDFLIQKTFRLERMNVISNKNWLNKGEVHAKLNPGGEQAIDVAYTVMTLCKFYEATGNETYFNLMSQAFDWFLGNNHLNQIIYNPVTGGCYDGLEAGNVNLNQGAESTLSFLMAKLTLEKSYQSKAIRQKLTHALTVS